MANAINWFEIPAANFDRATKFYSEVLNSELPQQKIMEHQMAFLPAQDDEVGGAIVYGEGFVPSMEGSLVYLNGGEDLDVFLSRVPAAGGEVLEPKTMISEENGFFAVFRDSEGNRMAFHSPH